MASKNIIEHCIKTDFIVVVGTNDELVHANILKMIKRNVMEVVNGKGPLYGNKMMFFGEAVRALKNNYDTDYKTVIYFKRGYTEKQIAAATEALKRYASKGRIFAVNSMDEFFSIINNPLFENETCERKIKRFEIYAHGLESSIEFGLTETGRSDKILVLDSGNAPKIDGTRFVDNAHIESYACRTGNYQDTPSKKSLAQKLADITNAKVSAFIKRSDYADWLNGANTIDIEEEDGIPGYGIGMDVANSRVIWALDGAGADVKVGTTPKDAPTGFWLFQRNEEPKKQ